MSSPGEPRPRGRRRSHALAPAFAARLALASLSLAPALALAQPMPGGGLPGEPPGQGAKDEEADALFARGNEAFDAGRLEEAYDLYQRAFAKKRAYDIAGNLGQVELKLGKYRDAAEHLAFTLKHFPPTGKTERRAGVQATFAAARKEVGALRVDANVRGAEVLVDGKVVGTSPIAEEVFVEAGAHKIEGRLEGYESARAEVSVARGGATDVRLELARREARSEAGPKPAVVAIGAGLAAVGVGLGVAFTIASNSASAEAAELRDGLVQRAGPNACGGALSEDCLTLHDELARAGSFRTLAIGSFVAGGVFGAATAVYLVWPRGPADAGDAKRRAHSPRLTPVVTPSFAGILVDRRF